MLAQIQSIEELETAISLMIAGRDLITLGLISALMISGLGVVSAIRKDERLAHAARRGQYALFFLTSVCVGLLYLGIFDGYYFVRYVSHVTENAEVLPFKISGLWASQQGSLLFWCFIMTGFGAAFAFTQRHNRTDRRMPYTLAVLALIEFFFFYIMTSPFSPDAANMTNPFAMDWAWMVGAVKENGEIVSWNGGQTLRSLFGDTGLRIPDAGIQTIKAFVGGEMSEGSLAAFNQTDWAGMKLSELHTMIETDFSSLPTAVKESMLLSYNEGGGMNPQLHNYWIAIHPPIALLGFRRFHYPIFLCDWFAAQWRSWRRLVTAHTPLDNGQLGVLDSRHCAGRFVGLRDSGLGWLLGLGPCRKRQLCTVADWYCVHSQHHSH